MSLTPALPAHADKYVVESDETIGYINILTPIRRDQITYEPFIGRNGDYVREHVFGNGLASEKAAHDLCAALNLGQSLNEGCNFSKLQELLDTPRQRNDDA